VSWHGPPAVLCSHRFDVSSSGAAGQLCVTDTSLTITTLIVVCVVVACEQSFNKSKTHKRFGHKANQTSLKYLIFESPQKQQELSKTN